MNGFSVLVLDDDDDLRHMFTVFLSRQGYQVRGAASIGEAQQLLDSQPFDVFLCDMRLGSERGIDLLRDCAQAKRYGRMQMIAMSAEHHYRQACEDLNIEFFISKPVSLQMLSKLLERLLPVAS
ncbi:MAG: response regulator [Chloroflexi bacterium]|nr:response regulator [Chloroflexota bacterium]